MNKGFDKIKNSKEFDSQNTLIKRYMYDDKIHLRLKPIFVI